MITSFTDAAGMGVALNTAGLFDPRNNSAIRGQVVLWFLLKGIADFRAHPGGQNDTDPLNAS